MRAPPFCAAFQYRHRAHQNRAHRKTRTARRLRLEGLERRLVFSAAPLAEVTDHGACLPEAVVLPDMEAQVLAQGEGELTPSPLGPAYPVVPDSSTTFLSPDANSVDVAFAQWASSDEPEGEMNSYMLHLEMTSFYMGQNIWSFSGNVTINGNVGAVKIKFGGLLEGHSVAVNDYGEFAYEHEFPNGTVGEVTGQAVSSSGYMSNVEKEYIFT